MTAVKSVSLIFRNSKLPEIMKLKKKKKGEAPPPPPKKKTSNTGDPCVGKHSQFIRLTESVKPKFK